MTNQKCILFFLLLISLHGIGQKATPSKPLPDSLKDLSLADLTFLNDDRSSYLKVNLALTNELFSVHNRALNALESDKKLVFTPSIGYFHKSGFSISFAGYLLKDSLKTKFYQYALTPAYDYEGKTVNAGVSFTRYFFSDSYKNNASPIQNDFYTYLIFKKPWLRPGVALGLSGGSAKDISTITANLPVLGTKTFIDTATTKLNDFTLTGTLEHTFTFDKLLSSKDYLDFTPGIMVNAGSSKYSITHKNIYSAKVQNKKAKIKGRTDVTSFELQSIGLNLDVNYSIGKFDFSPQLYLDYYLPETTDKRFTQVFAINIGYNF